MIGFGFVKDWKTLVGLRLILGILEVRNATIRTSTYLQPMFNRVASSPVSSISSVLGTNAVSIFERLIYALDSIVLTNQTE